MSRIPHILLAFAGVSAAGLALAPAAGAAPGTADEPCGYYQDHQSAWYNHCAQDTHVVINVDTIWAPDYERCVGPGTTFLGSTDDIRGAWYVGRTC